MLKPHLQIGRYHVLHALGRGKPDGLFAVTDAEGRRFAMRTPIGDLEESGTAITDRFIPHAEALKQVMHLNIVPLFGVFVTQEGYLCMVTELVSGRNLRFVIDHGGMGPREALNIARQILASAEVAHAAGQVHRAMDPSSVLLVRMEGWDLVKVADWGLATLRDEAVAEFGKDALIGSVRKPRAAYMAPEQVWEHAVDARTDLYAIGSIIFEMLTGRPPYLDSDPFNVKTLQVSGPVPTLDEIVPGKPWITPAMKALISGALAKDADERFQSAQQMIEAVDAAYASIQHLPVK